MMTIKHDIDTELTSSAEDAPAEDATATHGGEATATRHERDTTDVEAADSLKAWLSAPTRGDMQDDASKAADGPENASQEDVRPTDTPNGGEPQDDAQEPQDGPESSREQDAAADASKAADGPESTPQEDAPTSRDALERAYAELQAKVAELEAREAARLEANAKSEALAAAGIKGDYGQLLTGSKESWGEQIELLKQFVAENAPARPVRRDPALDADFDTEEEKITAQDFLKGSLNPT